MNKHYGSDCQASVEKKVEGVEGADELTFSAEDLAGLAQAQAEFDRTEEAQAWLRAVRGPANAHHPQAYRLLPESPAHKAADRASLRDHGKLASYAKKEWLDINDPAARRTLLAQNAKGYGIFGQLNYSILAQGGGAAWEDKRQVVVPAGAPMCLCADLDFGSPLRDRDTLPITMIVQSSRPGKMHIYLRCAPGTTQVQWQWMQMAWVAFWGADPAIKDLPRIIRLPGFTHRKGDPLQSKILQVAEEVEISYADLRHTMREIGAGDLTRMTAQEIDDIYTTLHAGYVRGIVAEDQLRDIANPGHPELVREIKAHSQLLQARLDYLKHITPAAKMRWPVPAPEFTPGEGLARQWQLDAQGYKNLSLFQFLGNLPCFNGQFASAEATEALAGAVASTQATNPTWEPLHALLFGSHPFRSSLFGWIRTTNTALDDALGQVPIRPGSPCLRDRTPAEKAEVIAAFAAAAPYDHSAIYSDTELMAEDDGALAGAEIRLASGDLITVAQIRTGAIGHGEWSSCFCPFHVNSLSTAATVSLGKNGQVRLICRGECNKTYTSGRLVPRALSEIGWVGGHPHPPITATMPNGEVSRYLPEFVVREGVRLLVICAPTGSGKTTQIKRIADTYKRATLVTPTQGLSASGARWLGGISHLNCTDKVIADDRVATTIDSLHRVPPSEVCPDTFQTLSRGGVLILDEYDQIEKRMFLDSNISSKAAKNRATLIEHGAAADLIIAASAGLDAGHLQNLQEMFGLAAEEIQVISMPAGAPQAHQGRVMEFFERAEQAVLRVCGLLEAGERVVVPATEKRFVEVLAHFLREKFPTKKGIVLHAEATQKDLETLKDVNSGWKDADYVLYNLKCGSGISYDASNEYHTVMIAHTIRSAKGGVGADDLLQLSHRVRNPKSWSAWVSALPGNTPLEAEEVLRRTINKVRQHDWLISQFAPHLTSVGAGNDPVCKHGARVQAAASLQAATPREDMLQALTRQRAVLVAVPAPTDGSPDHADLEAVEELFDAVRQQIKDAKTVQAIISEPLSQNEMKKVEMEKQAQTAEDRAAYAAAKTLDRYGRGAVDQQGNIDVALLEDTLDRGEKWKQHRRLAHTCMALGGMVDVLVAHEGRFGADGGALALDGSTLLARSVASIIKALGGSGGVDVITEQSGELEGVEFVGAESFIKEKPLPHGINLPQSNPPPSGFSFSDENPSRTGSTSKPSSATPNLTLNTEWSERTIPQKTADLLCLLRDQFPTLIPGLKLMLADGNLLGAVNASLRVAGIPITERQVLVPDAAASAAAEARRKAHAQAMRLWRKAKAEAEEKGITPLPAKPVCPPRIHRDRTRTYGVDQDALALALRRSERYALGLLGGQQAPIESFDPRVCGIQESPDVVAMLNLSSPAPQVIVSPTPKAGRANTLRQKAADARAAAIEAEIKAAIAELDMHAAVEEMVMRPAPAPAPAPAPVRILTPTPTPEPETTWEEPQLIYRIALYGDGGEARMALRSRCLRDALAQFDAQAEALAEAEGTPLIGWRPPSPEEADEIFADLPDEFWQQEAA